MKIKKVLLLVPPAITFRSSRDINPLPPLGLGYLAAVVENLGIEVKILDCLMRGWEKEEIIDGRLIRIGLSDDEIKGLISDFDPDIAGGAHATVCPEEILLDKFCDYVLMGEAESTFKEFILTSMTGKDVSHIDGLCKKIGDKIFINEKKSWIENLDYLPFPSYRAMELERYFGINNSHGLRHRKKFCPIITSRGCVAKCIFCSANKVWGPKFRFRSVENILKEMSLLRDNYGIEELMFEDDNLTANSLRAKALFEAMIREKLNFIWDTPNGVGAWSIDTDTIDLMKRSGCIQLNFPIESGSQRVLTNIINKPLDLSKAKLLIEHCRKINLAYSLFLVIGLPGEKIKDIWKSFRFAAKCKCFNPFISIATPYPGTRLFSRCKENKYFSRDFSLEDLFITSFMIETPEWNEKQLQKVLLKGMVYLKIMSFINNPKSTLKLFAQLLINPIKLAVYLKKLFHKYSHIKKNILKHSYW
jgi:magnesium-protoporphyrin IX monomethyl ester (oxidative) cyclase